MKQVSFLFIAFCILFFSACKKEEDLSTEDKIIGKWVYETIKSTEYKNSMFVESETEAIIGATMEFKSNGTYDAIFTDDNDYGLSKDGTWKLIENDKKLILGKEGRIYVDTLSIEELTNKKLRLLYQEEFIGGGTTYRSEQETSFKK